MSDIIDDTETILAMLFSSYPNVEVPEATVAMYVRLLMDIPPVELRTAVEQCVATCRFMPTVAEIRERWHELTHGLAQPSATEGWDEVQREIRRVGYIGVPYFANPLTDRVVRAMNWRDLCASENVIADRAHFMKMYEQLAERGEQVSRLLPQALDFAEKRAGLTHIRALLPQIIVVEDSPNDK